MSPIGSATQSITTNIQATDVTTQQAATQTEDQSARLSEGLLPMIEKTLTDATINALTELKDDPSSSDVMDIVAQKKIIRTYMGMYASIEHQQKEALAKIANNI